LTAAKPRALIPKPLPELLPPSGQRIRPCVTWQRHLLQGKCRFEWCICRLLFEWYEPLNVALHPPSNPQPTTQTLDLRALDLDSIDYAILPIPALKRVLLANNRMTSISGKKDAEGSLRCVVE
jgi:hypothetical protein